MRSSAPASGAVSYARVSVVPVSEWLCASQCQSLAAPVSPPDSHWPRDCQSCSQSVPEWVRLGHQSASQCQSLSQSVPESRRPAASVPVSVRVAVSPCQSEWDSATSQPVSARVSPPGSQWPSECQSLSQSVPESRRPSLAARQPVAPYGQHPAAE